MTTELMATDLGAGLMFACVGIATLIIVMRIFLQRKTELAIIDARNLTELDAINRIIEKRGQTLTKLYKKCEELEWKKTRSFKEFLDDEMIKEYFPERTKEEEAKVGTKWSAQDVRKREKVWFGNLPITNYAKTAAMKHSKHT